MKTIKIGIFGFGRGGGHIDYLLQNNAEIVAVCEKNEKSLKFARDKLGDIGLYTDFDKFIEHEGLEAVLIANYFHEHAPYAIKALNKNIHVLSECTSNVTMAEGVALVRAAEKSKAIYMIAENYPYMPHNREIRNLYNKGDLGRLMYAESEYNHPFDPYDPYCYGQLIPYAKHWRNIIPITYYITHSLGPLMYITDVRPKKVSAFPISFDYDKDFPLCGLYTNDRTAIIITQNEDNSVFRVSAWAQFGAHNYSTRVCGDRGQAENIHGYNDELVNVRFNYWSIPEGKQIENMYKPYLNDPDHALMEKATHGGGDFVVAREFLSCIREGRRPQFDVYFATTMASVGILAHRSILNGGEPIDIPDFRLEEDRLKYENDTLSPFYGPDGSEPTIRTSSKENDINWDKIAKYDSYIKDVLDGKLPGYTSTDIKVNAD